MAEEDAKRSPPWVRPQLIFTTATPVQITTGSTSTNIVAMLGSNEVLPIAGIVPIHDALGSVLAAVNSSGAFQYQYTYDPFGNFTTSGQPPSGYGNAYAMAGIEIDSSANATAWPVFMLEVNPRDSF
ncbi:MAG TPA: hypothetical protein VIX59_08300 [Candidatus Binataceae bacterium]